MMDSPMVGFRSTKELVGQSSDGHEQDDVVHYCQSLYVPFWQSLERLMTTFNENGVPDLQRPFYISLGKKAVIVWLSDESVLFGNNRRLVLWIGAEESATAYKKGESNTIMVGDFVSAKFGCLKGKSG
jgi:hypothetical protein